MTRAFFISQVRLLCSLITLFLLFSSWTMLLRIVPVEEMVLISIEGTSSPKSRASERDHQLRWFKVDLLPRGFDWGWSGGSTVTIDVVNVTPNLVCRSVSHFEVWMYFWIFFISFYLFLKKKIGINGSQKQCHWSGVINITTFGAMSLLYS